MAGERVVIVRLGEWKANTQNLACVPAAGGPSPGGCAGAGDPTADLPTSALLSSACSRESPGSAPVSGTFTGPRPRGLLAAFCKQPPRCVEHRAGWPGSCGHCRGWPCHPHLCPCPTPWFHPCLLMFCFDPLCPPAPLFVIVPASSFSCPAFTS